MACSSVSKKFVSADNMEVSGSNGSNTELSEIIEPYKDSIEAEMNEVIAVADMDYIVERPSGNLNNWVADAIFSSETKNKRLSLPAFCLLNTGGIRSTLNKGNITVGDIFKIAPFDNEIVWVRMPVSSLVKIEEYLIRSGGEPISNAQLADGKLILGGLRPSSDEVIIITSDYLFNGGDNMDFFKDNIEVTFTGKLLRDALIEEARYQEVLIHSTETRISF